MIWAWVAGASLLIWLGLLIARDGFWLTRERDTHGILPQPAAWPPVTAVVPARDEADVIAATIASLIAQDYPGAFKIILVDDSSTDGTAEAARRAAGASERLTILSAAPLAPGWTGKLWAVSQGIAAAGTIPRYLLLTDADIAHDADSVRMLVMRAEAGGLKLVSLMAKLRCISFAERALIPAFVFFFQLLYPFAQVNRPRGPGAAAGGCMLVDRDTLAQAGGIGAIRGALIDDCAFGAMIKRHGPIWLGLTSRVRSIRPYDHWQTVAAMISRSAYAQLAYSPLLLAGTLAGLALVYAAPPLLALFGSGTARWLALAAWLLMALAFQPMLRFYQRSPLWGAALPLIAAFYAGCTWASAWQHWRGRGGLWKGRVQAAIGA
ncbi:glycosyltransferase [Novosphingobium sp. Chol11]|uniref:glycosyltransferase n=1 Tax=Novosphingobium sp. Chol11 TaxID=1385763 RepID=UPI0025E4BC39|nr:glycosyltransferase [Novosphingobium sp. Chol11]